MQQAALEEWSRGSSYLHSRDARAKLITIVLLLIAIGVTPLAHAYAFALYGIGLTISAWSAGLPVGAMLVRLLAISPIILMFGVASWLSGDQERATLIVVRGLLSAFTALLLIATTPAHHLFRGLERLRVPPILISVIQTVYRYLSVLAAEAAAMRSAARSRSGRLGFSSFSQAASAISVLFARSYERAQTIHRAMLARGAAGPLPEGTDPVASVIEARGLKYTYPDGTQALRGIHLSVAGGESVILFGSNGSGKTTFLLHLNGLLTGEGELLIAGALIGPANLKQIRRQVGMVFQDADSQLFMPTVLEDVSFGPLQHGMPPAEAERIARAALAQVGLEQVAARPPYHLSSGEKRRAAIAGVLATSPQLLVFDEPTTYLDPPAQRQLITLLRQLPQTKIIATHDAAFARAIGTRAVFFDGGIITDQGTVDEIVERHHWSPA